MTNAIMFAAPMRGATAVVADSTTAPHSPPVQAHQGRPVICDSFGHALPDASATHASMAATSNAERAAAQRGPPIARPKRALTSACKGSITPAVTARRKKNQDIAIFLVAY